MVNLFTSQSQGNESGFSNEACAAPKAPLVVPAYFAFFDYDKAGNRKTITAIDRKSTYTYDAENRLTTETPLISQKVSLLNVSASDTETKTEESRNSNRSSARNARPALGEGSVSKGTASISRP